jgi:molecular chaperone GrpE
VSEPSLQDLFDQICDLGRIVARQGASVDRLVDDARAAAGRARAGADIPLLLDLFALYSDATTCASTARSRRERAAFEALATGLERLLAVADVVATEDPTLDRTVDVLLEPGLRVTEAGRSVRPAQVVVRRHQRPG